MATISAFPDPVFNGGPTPTNQGLEPPDFKTTRFYFEDGGEDVNVRPCGPQRWVFVFEGLTEAQAAVLDAHYNLAKGRTNSFSFYDRRTGFTYSGVEYAAFEVPAHQKQYIQTRNIQLVRST